jgi:hypothetical protein
MNNGTPGYAEANLVRAKERSRYSSPGFVGVNLADRLLLAGEKVVLFDNLRKCGTRRWRCFDRLPNAEMDGVTLAREIRKRAQTPLLLLSSSGEIITGEKHG